MLVWIGLCCTAVSAALGSPGHKWVGGHTFEYEFDLHMAVNRHYSAKPAVETKADKSQEGPAKPKSTTTQDKAAKPTNGERPRSLPTNERNATERRQPNAARTGRNRVSVKTAPTGPRWDRPAAPTAPKSTA